MDGGAGRLVGACLTDRQGDGLSMIYSFYDPEHEARTGLGNYIILDHIRRAADGGPALRLPRLLGRWRAADAVQGPLPPARAARPRRVARVSATSSRPSSSLRLGRLPPRRCSCRRRRRQGGTPGGQHSTRSPDAPPPARGARCVALSACSSPSRSRRRTAPRARAQGADPGRAVANPEDVGARRACRPPATPSPQPTSSPTTPLAEWRDRRALARPARVAPARPADARARHPVRRVPDFERPVRMGSEERISDELVLHFPERAVAVPRADEFVKRFKQLSTIEKLDDAGSAARSRPRPTVDETLLCGCCASTAITIRSSRARSWASTMRSRRPRRSSRKRASHPAGQAVRVRRDRPRPAGRRRARFPDAARHVRDPERRSAAAGQAC